MKLTDQQLSELSAIYKAKFGVELTKKEALEKALQLINLFKAILLENERQEKLSNIKK